MEAEQAADFRKIFEALPGLYLILTPQFKIVAVSDSYLAATNTVREQILGKGLFEVFPDNPDDPAATGVANLTYSLEEVLKTKAPHNMAIQKYDIPIPDSDGRFEVRYWSPSNSPVLNDDDTVLYLVHCVSDVTKTVEAELNEDRLKAANQRMTNILEDVLKK